MFLLKLISIACGWGYTTLWAISWYIPVINNIKLKTVEGISLDYCTFLGVGYIFYAFSIGSLLYNSTIREEYALRHTPMGSDTLKYPLLNTNDFIFCLHSNLMNSIVVSQFFCWGFKSSKKIKISHLSGSIMFSSVISAFVLAVYIKVTNEKYYQWLDLVQFIGTLKVFLSFCKCIPQILHIIKRKSTFGWPISMVWVDFYGGVLSVAQMLCEGANEGDVFAIFYNLPKLLLGCNTIFFDGIFIFLHYVQYPEKKKSDYAPIFEDTESLVGFEECSGRTSDDGSSTKKNSVSVTPVKLG